jgi:hypothetical protein
MMPLPYVLATSAVPDDSRLSPLSIPHWNSPDPGRWTVEKLPPLPPSQPTETHASRPLPMSSSMPERVRRNRDTAEPSPRPMSATEPPLTASFSRHCPSSSPRPCCFPVPIKTPRRCPEAAHHHRYRSQPFALLLPLRIVRILQDRSTTIRRNPATIGDAAGTRRGVEPPLLSCFIADDPCFLSAQPRHRHSSLW